MPDVVLYSRLHVEPNPAHLLNQVLPIGFHGPPPAVAVCSGIIDVTDIVHQDTPEPDANRLPGEAECLRPLVPELQLHPDPVLVLRQAPLCRFVVNTNQDRALFAAVVNRNPWPSVFELLFNPGLSELAHKLLLPVLVVAVPEKLPDIQDAGMVVKSHVQPGHMVALPLLEQPEQPIEISGPVLLEAPAALAGHIQTGPHSRIAVIQNRNAAKVKPFPVSVPAMAQLVPAAALHPQQLHPGLRVLLLTAYRQPIVENDIL